MNVDPRVILEVCIASVHDALAAVAGGADRLELNMAVELGGLTPSVGVLEEVKQAVDLPVLAMIRPRAAGFQYSTAELAVMLRDAELMLAAGADGIVTGALTEDGLLPVEFWSRLRQLVDSRELVLHRVIDASPKPSVVLKQLIELGGDRVLTSGGEATAWEGRREISQLQGIAAGRIGILPGCGITPQNAVEVLESTGCNQLHGTFRTWSKDPAGIVCDDRYPSTSKHIVAAMRTVLDTISDS